MVRPAHLALLLALGCSGGPSTDDAPPAMPEFRPVDRAITAEIKRGVQAPVGQSGYLVVALVPSTRGLLRIADVASDSPADKAGLKAGDLLLELDGEPVDDVDRFRDQIHAAAPGEETRIVVSRQGARTELTAQFGALSRPMKIGERRAVMGVQMGEPVESGGAPITRLTSGSAAEKAGLKTGDILLRIDGAAITSSNLVADSLSEKKPGDIVTVVVQRSGRTEEVKVTLGSDPASEGLGAGFFRGGSYWKKDVYRLAVIPIEFPDAKHNRSPLGSSTIRVG